MSATAEDEYLVGDWNGDGKDDLAVRRGSTILKDINGDGRHDLEQVFGLGNAENQYLVGDWNGDGKDDLAVRRGSTILMDINGDGRHDLQQTFGRGNRENQYLIGDWNGDGIDDIAVRRGSMVLVDVNRDGNRDLQQTFGLGASEAQYLVGDWNGDGKDDLAVRRGSTVLKDINGDGRHDLSQSFGLGGGEDQYLVGDWNRDGKDDIAVRRGSTVLMDINGDSRHDLQQTFGLGTAKPPAVSPVSPPPSEPANYTALSPKPRRTSINQGLLSPSPSFMESILGRPGALTNSCSLVTNSKLRRLLVTQDVGPITVTGLRPAVETLGAIFAQVRREKPKLYSQIGSAGMLCVRRVRGGSGFSNHSWGTAIDITINKRLDTFGDDRTQLGLKVLYPYFHKAGFYWGAGFSNREDSMHFEASRQLIQQWRSQRRI
ncbi:MAG: M15 family metallopeptidase [Elainella sp.]